MEWLTKIWHPVVCGELLYRQGRYIIAANRLTLVFISTALATELVALSLSVATAAMLLPLVFPTLVLLAVPPLNKEGSTIGRMVLTVFFPLYFVSAGIYLNRFHPSGIPSWFDVRLALLPCSLIPFLLFGMVQKTQLFFGLFTGAVSIAFYRPLLRLFAAGDFFDETGLTAYPSSDVVFCAAFIFFAALSWSVFSGQENTIRMLIEKDVELTTAKAAALIQQEAWINQAESLKQSEEKYLKSQIVAEEQNIKFNSHNKLLEDSIRNKTAELLHTNEELAKHNNELLQFSFTISHNLRGPVARLLGLSELMDINGGTPEIYQHMKSSSLELEQVMKDLSRIINIRNEMYRIREKVNFEEEWQRLRENFTGQLDLNDRIDTDFTDAPWIVSIRPMVSSILYNLVSNAIKYRSYSKALRISIETTRDNGFVQLQVSDNGLGIDLKEYGDHMFKLYKRFHLHKEGKGMGLFLVKTQSELLGGRVSVVSEANKGSEFNIFFKSNNEREAQLCLSEPCAAIYFHAWLDALEFRWRGAPKFRDLEDVFEKGKGIVKSYKAKYLISDVRGRTLNTPQEQQFALEKIIPSMYAAGIKKIFIIQYANKIVVANPDVLQAIRNDDRMAIATSFEEVVESIEGEQIQDELTEENT